MVRKTVCLLFVFACLALHACQTIPDAAAESLPANDDASALSIQEHDMLLLVVFSLFTISDIHWNEGDKMLEIIEFWKDGQVAQSSEVFLNQPHFGEPLPPAGSMKLVHGVQDNIKSSEVIPDQIQVHSIYLAGNGTSGGSRVQSFPVDMAQMRASLGNVIAYPEKGLSAGESVQLLEYLYVGGSHTPGEAAIENALYGVRVYIKNDR